MSGRKSQKERQRFWRLITIFGVLILIIPLIIHKAFFDASTSQAAEFADNSLVFYAVDAMYGKTISDIENNLVDDAGLQHAKVSIHLNNEALYLEPVGSGEYNLANNNTPGAVTEAETSADGRVIIHGLDKNETKYQLWVPPAYAPEGFYHPTTRRFAEPEKVVSGEKTVWFSMFEFHARELLLRAQLDDGSPLNGVNLGFMYTDDHSYAKFVKITDGIYRQAQSGDTEITTLLVSANVEGEDGVVLIHGMDHTRSGIATGLQPTPGYYVGTQFPNIWRQPRSYDSDIRRIDCGTVIYHIDPFNPNSIPLPSPLVGYGEWEINPKVSDEFEGSALNLSKWRTKYVHENPDNAYLSGDGYLYNVITKDDANRKVDRGAVWSHDIDSMYGYFECRFKGAYLPGMANFWLLAQGDQHAVTEIDISENVIDSNVGGVDRLMNMNAHYPSLIDELGKYSTRTTSGRTTLLPDNKSTTGNFITYAALWEPGKVTYYVDGQVMYVLERDYAAPMGIIIEILNGSAYSDLSAADLEATHMGFPANAMVVDYVRSWTRTDINYVPQAEQPKPDDHVVTLPQTPAISIDESWNLNTALSDEFNDNRIDGNLWGSYHEAEAEAYETLRLPKAISDDYNGKYPVGLTGNQAVDDYIAKYYRNGWISFGKLSTNASLNHPYGYGYYEFRAKAADNTAFSQIALTTSNSNGTGTGEILLSLRTDAVKNTDRGYYAELTATDNTNNQNESHREITLQSAADDYNVYGILRLEDKTVFYINGEMIYQTGVSPEGNVSVSMQVIGNDYQNGSDTYDRMTDGRDNTFYIDFFRYYSDGVVNDNGSNSNTDTNSNTNGNNNSENGGNGNTGNENNNTNNGNNNNTNSSENNNNSNTNNSNNNNSNSTNNNNSNNTTNGNNTDSNASTNPITAFTVRLYDGVFKRNPDADGLKFWIDNFTENRVTASEAVFFFFTSPEMKNLNLNDGEYIERLYSILMGREYDETGKKFWLSYIEKGVSRIGILRQFLDSQEFKNICANAGIRRGDIPAANEARDENPHLTAFLYRQYQTVMSRKIDISGLNYWAGKYLYENLTIEEISKSLFFSEEVLAKQWSNDTFLNALYRTFFDRDAEPAGKTFWLNALTKGTSKNAVLNFFAYSDEFARLTKESGF